MKMVLRFITLNERDNGYLIGVNMIYLSDEEQEIFDEGFNAKSMHLPYCPYELGTLGYILWWRGFESNE